MRTFEETKSILLLSSERKNKSEISRLLGISRPTIRDIVKRYPGGVSQLAEEADLKFAQCRFESDRHYQFLIEKGKQYSYLLGIYLGDGYIDKQPRTYRLRVFQNSKYTDMIDRIKKTIEDIFPKNKVKCFKQKKANCVTICCYSNSLPFIFPQHGSGKKHDRDIKLEEWQREIVDGNSVEFIRGLIESDGCRYTVKKYLRTIYSFSNKSSDIKELFKYYCEKIGISFAHSEKSNKIVFINKKKDVLRLDELFGKS